MISVEDFKRFLGFSLPADSGSPSFGILQFQKTLATATITIKAGAMFSTDKGLAFIIPDGPWELSESRPISDPLPIGAESRLPGIKYNISANQNWKGPFDSFSVSNPNDFTQGRDPLPATAGLYPESSAPRPPDSRLQSCLDVGTAFIRSMLGLKSGEDLDQTNSLIKEAIYLVGSFRLSNTQFQTLEYPVPSQNSLNAQVTAMYRDRSYAPLLNEVKNLLYATGKVNFNRLLGNDPPQALEMD